MRRPLNNLSEIDIELFIFFIRCDFLDLKNSNQNLDSFRVTVRSKVEDHSKTGTPCKDQVSNIIKKM